MQDNLGGDFKEFQSALRRWGLICLTSRKAHCVSSRDGHKVCVKTRRLDTEKQITGSTIGIIVGGALALTGVIGAMAS